MYICIYRQITASVTFLPIIETSCSFDLLVYTHRDTNIPNNVRVKCFVIYAIYINLFQPTFIVGNIRPSIYKLL